MIKKFSKFFRGNKKVETDDDLIVQLMDSITYDNFKLFMDAINKGVDINVVVSAGIGNLYSPFVSCLIHKNVKFAKILIENGVNLFKQPINTSIDEYMKMSLNNREYNEIMYYILKKYPNFKEELEIRKSGSKYNL